MMSDFGPNGLDANTIAPDTGTPDPVPSNRYILAMTKAEDKPSGKNVTFQILEGEYKGRLIFEHFGTKHENAQTREIALKRISALCYVTKVMKPMSFNEFFNIPFAADVGMKAPENGYPAKNKINKFLYLDGSEIGKVGGGGGATATAAAPAAPTAVQQPNWVGKAKAA